MRQWMHLGATEITWSDDQQWLVTRFLDGAEVHAARNVDRESVGLALDLGYGDDTWQMSRDHEVGHTWIAVIMGGQYSRTMWRVAHPLDEVPIIGDSQVAHEEAIVLNWQRGLVKTAERPWAPWISAS